jgi:hypothetical protein
MVELTTQVLVNQPGDASVCQPVELDLQCVVAGKQRHPIFQSGVGGAIPKVKMITITLFLLSQHIQCIWIHFLSRHV